MCARRPDERPCEPPPSILMDEFMITTNRGSCRGGVAEAASKNPLVVPPSNLIITRLAAKSISRLNLAAVAISTPSQKLFEPSRFAVKAKATTMTTTAALKEEKTHHHHLGVCVCARVSAAIFLRQPASQPKNVLSGLAR